MNKLTFAEYLWIDGAQPTQGLRSKSKIVDVPANAQAQDFPLWSFDGSSTDQAEGNDSDCLLKPVRVVRDPTRQGRAYLVMCEVLNPDGSAHDSNTRANLRRVLVAGAAEAEAWIGFEQEYTLFQSGRPLGFPDSGFPAAQGPYYCGVGTGRVFGRELVEAHARACLDAGVMLYGVNAEVMPGQWEYQIGYRGMAEESADLLTVSDHAWIARWLLQRVAEQFGVTVSFENKPVKGDWNGAGMHTNFSTAETRDPVSGSRAIKQAILALGRNHKAHIAVYGDRLDERLTGDHETCSISTFKSGAADRGASIRVPQPVQINGYGYFEDRRPGANADPYAVAAELASTVCGSSSEVSSKAA